MVEIYPSFGKDGKLVKLRIDYIKENISKEYIEKENIQVVNAGIKNIEILSYYNMLPKIFERIIIEDYTILQIGITNLLNLYSRKINQKEIENLVNNTKNN